MKVKTIRAKVGTQPCSIIVDNINGNPDNPDCIFIALA